MTEEKKLPLHRKYRPKTLDEIVGNASLKEQIGAAFSRENAAKPHTVLLQGTSGCGKTTLARILASMLGVHEDDISEMNISNTRGIDDARKIIDNVSYSSL